LFKEDWGKLVYSNEFTVECGGNEIYSLFGMKNKKAQSGRILHKLCKEKGGIHVSHSLFS
jgi:hypothetical protein